MRKRTVLLSITAAGIAGAAAFGWVTIRRGFSARDNRRECVPNLLDLISHQKIKLFANTSFHLANVRTAFEALSSRRTIGKVVLTPYQESQTIGTSFRGD
jgi:NADPH:quinone reductase-like Zn-dependent oxidoreductase